MTTTEDFKLNFDKTVMLAKVEFDYITSSNSKQTGKGQKLKR